MKKIGMNLKNKIKIKYKFNDFKIFKILFLIRYTFLG